MKNIIILLVLMLSLPAMAGYEIKWSSIDGGGGQSSGGDYQLLSTIGQPDADWAEGGPYEVLGGFLPGGPLCTIAFDDFARFAVQWRDSGVGLASDLYADEVIDELDLDVLVGYWLEYCPNNWPLR